MKAKRKSGPKKITRARMKPTKIDRIAEKFTVDDKAEVKISYPLLLDHGREKIQAILNKHPFGSKLAPVEKALAKVGAHFTNWSTPPYPGYSLVYF